MGCTDTSINSHNSAYIHTCEIRWEPEKSLPLFASACCEATEVTEDQHFAPSHSLFRESWAHALHLPHFRVPEGYRGGGRRWRKIKWRWKRGWGRRVERRRRRRRRVQARIPRYAGGRTKRDAGSLRDVMEGIGTKRKTHTRVYKEAPGMLTRSSRMSEREKRKLSQVFEGMKKDEWETRGMSKKRGSNLYKHTYVVKQLSIVWTNRWEKLHVQTTRSIYVYTHVYKWRRREGAKRGKEAHARLLLPFSWSREISSAIQQQQQQQQQLEWRGEKKREAEEKVESARRSRGQLASAHAQRPRGLFFLASLISLPLHILVDISILFVLIHVYVYLSIEYVARFDRSVTKFVNSFSGRLRLAISRDAESFLSQKSHAYETRTRTNFQTNVRLSLLNMGCGHCCIFLSPPVPKDGATVVRSVNSMGKCIRTSMLSVKVSPAATWIVTYFCSVIDNTKVTIYLYCEFYHFHSYIFFATSNSALLRILKHNLSAIWKIVGRASIENRTGSGWRLRSIICLTRIQIFASISVKI